MRAAAPPMSAVPRKFLGRFEIVRVLGKGAMGIVYEGLDPRLERRVAIKTILRSAILDEEEARDYAARFVREAQAVARLTHPHIVGVYDFGEEGDITFIVMEFIDGRELKSYLDAGQRFDFPNTVRIMNELLGGLGYAHSQGVVHRDIKPANIMIDSAGRVKLTDFGVARISESAERTQVGTMVGTPSYMSPEQIQGGSTDNRTDLFACGVILYQLLTGEKPFTGAGTWTIYNQILLHDPKPVTASNALLPTAIDRVVNKALAKNKDDRYRNASEMASALTALLLGTEDGEGAAEPDEDATRFLLPSDAIRMAEAATQRHAEAGAAVRSQPGTSTSPRPATGAQELELEFWRSIKDSGDPADHELYLEQFPAGVYAELARRKTHRLRNPATADATDPTSRALTAASPDRDPAPRTESEPAAVSAEARPSGTAAGAEASISRPPAAAERISSRGLIFGGSAGLAALALIAWLIHSLDGPSLVATPPAASTAVPAAVSPTAAPSPAQTGPTPAVTAAPPPPPAQAPSSAPAAGSARVQPKEDADALRRIDAAIERAASDGEAEKARKRAAAERAAAEKAAARAAAERAAADKAAERAAADRVAAERAVAERAAADRAAIERATADRAAAEKSAAERLAAEKATASARAASERVAIEKAALERATAERAAAAKAAAIDRALADERAAAASRAAEPAKRAGGRQN